MDRETLRTKNLALLGLWMAGSTHDINNLLGAILMNVSLARRFAAHVDQAVERLEEAEKAVAQLRDVASRLHGAGRIVAPRPQAVDLAALTARALTELSSVTLAAGVVFQPPAQPAPVWADPEAVLLGVLNVLNNAVEASPQPGSVQVGITLLPEATQPLASNRRYWRLTVTDRGGGIPVELLETVMEPGTSTREGHSGLGLPVTQVLMRRQGGRLLLQLEEGGLRVCLDFPLAEAGARMS